jgi:Domain of unknown function (DUF4124)
MNRQKKWPWSPTLLLLCCLPSFAATVYKSIDANGVVTYSDSPPADDVMVETLVFDELTVPAAENERQRLQDMRETTDRMIADRMAREKHRAEVRKLAAEAQAQSRQQQPPAEDDSVTFYPGYYGGYPIHRPWWPPNHLRPRPPLLPPVVERPPLIRPLPGNNYPASLIRRHYDPKVQEAFR